MCWKVQIVFTLTVLFSFNLNIATSNRIIRQALKSAPIKCPPLKNTRSVRISCEYEGDNVDCSDAVAGTVATFECAPLHQNVYLALNPYSICINGAWTARVPECNLLSSLRDDKECGVIATRTFNTQEETIFPWTVYTYQNMTKKSGSQFELICGGTLITGAVFLTAAHCFVINNGDGEKTNRNPKDYLAGAGILLRAYNDPKDQQYAQYRKVKSIFVHEDFHGLNLNYAADFAIVTVEKSFHFNQYVHPVCVSWQDTNEEFWVTKYQTIVPGIPYKEYNKSTNAPAVIEAPYTIPEECRKEMSADFRKFFTNDKICSVFSNSSSGDCRTFSGTGLTFRNSNNNKYYLIGIASVAPNSKDYSCNKKVVTLFTEIFQYSDRISALVKRQTPSHNLYEYVCGIKSVQAQTLIIEGKIVTKGDYPWQVAIYKEKLSGVKKLVCGATLISNRVVVTAAHCVTNSKGETLPKKLFSLYAGKYFRNFTDDRDVDAQLAFVQEIFVPSLYQGETQNFVADIAVIITDRKFVFSKQIQSICLDWDSIYENRLLRTGNKGFVSGWGYTSQNGAPSEVLKDIEVPFIERNQCEKELPEDYDIYLTYDKLCSGFLNQNAGVCVGDSGGGLVFKNEVDGRYYLVGIVSLSPQAPEGGCDSRQYALYTKVYPYVQKFIFETVSSFLS